jgi:DnaJ-class molecular chaperone
VIGSFILEARDSASFSSSIFSGGTRYGFPQDVDEGFYQTHFADTGGIRPKRGSDIEGEFLITLEEAMHGTVRPISLQIFNRQTGKTETQSFKIRIPSGAVDGRRIRVPGHGEPGYGGGRAGDLFLRLRHAVHPDFTSRDADIFHELDIAPWEAVLGAELSVPTLDGSIKLRVPVHSQHGQKLRVRGRGLPKGKSGTRGDFIVILTLQFPKTIGYDERVLWGKATRCIILYAALGASCGDCNNMNDDPLIHDPEIPVYGGEAEGTYTIEMIAELAGMDSRTVLRYQESGYIHPVANLWMGGNPGV